MFKSFVVGLDGSELSDVAQAWAIDVAKNHKAELLGLAVLDVPGITHTEPIPIGGSSFKLMRDEAILRDTRERISGFLGVFSEACAKAAVESRVGVREGNPAAEIGQEARAHDLLVVGRETHFTWGSDEGPEDTLRQLLRESPRPVVVTPTRLQQGSGVVVAYDDSTPSARALQLFLLSGLFGQQKVSLVSLSRDRAKATQMMVPAVRLLQIHGRTVETLPIETESDLADVLMSEVQTLRPEILVMGCYGHSGLKEKLFGTTTGHVLFREKCPTPIFLYH